MWDLHAITHYGPPCSVEEDCPNYLWNNLISIVIGLSRSITHTPSLSHTQTQKHKAWSILKSTVQMRCRISAGGKFKVKAVSFAQCEDFPWILKIAGQNFHSRWQLKEPYFSGQFCWGLSIDSCLCMSGLFFLFFFSQQPDAWEHTQGLLFGDDSPHLDTTVTAAIQQQYWWDIVNGWSRTFLVAY